MEIRFRISAECGLTQLATVRLKLEGEAKSIPLRVFLTAVQNELKILADLDTAISGEPKGTLDWYVTEMRVGSLEVVTESRSRSDYRDIGAEVSKGIVASLEEIERRGATPPYLSHHGMQSVKKLLGTVGKGKATGLLMASPSENVSISVTAKAADNVRQLLPIRYHSLGSVEGKIEMINIHGGSRFVVYDSRTRRAITCQFDSKMWMDTVKKALGQRVNISGMVHANTRGEPLRVEIDDIRILRSKKELPSIDDIAGIDPDFTGRLSTADYLRSLSLA